MSSDLFVRWPSEGTFLALLFLVPMFVPALEWWPNRHRRSRGLVDGVAHLIEGEEHVVDNGVADLARGPGEVVLGAVVPAVLAALLRCPKGIPCSVFKGVAHRRPYAGRLEASSASWQASGRLGGRRAWG